MTIKSKKNRIRLHFLGGIIIIIFVSLIMESFLLTKLNEMSSSRTSEIFLGQVVSVLEKNVQNENEMISALKEEYMIKAKSVSYFLDHSAVDDFDINELKNLSTMMEIDEIHLFD